jgi:hypothetical protein
MQMHDKKDKFAEMLSNLLEFAETFAMTTKRVAELIGEDGLSVRDLKIGLSLVVGKADCERVAEHFMKVWTCEDAPFVLRDGRLFFSEAGAGHALKAIVGGENSDERISDMTRRAVAELIEESKTPPSMN